MCGIAGAITQAGSTAGIVDEQLRLLRHRGPDSHGVFARDGGAVGQNRLAIIDLETGDPPIANEDGTYGVVLNGEIYNFRALRGELERAGHRFTTAGDTETIVHLAEDEEPVKLARRLHGMFAFAVWDERRRRLVLGRDRVGKKPLYYYASEDGGTFVFASEIKAILAHPAVPRELEPRAIPAYLTFGYVPTPFTFYKRIRSVPPGHVLTHKPGHAPTLAPYWRPPLSGVRTKPIDATPPQAAAQVRARLEQAVSDRLVSDVPLGAFLSGGIDSGAIVAIMARAGQHPVRTFTIGFEDRDGFDERDKARLVARRYGTEHHELVVAPDAIDLIERLVWHHDQPFGDSSAVPTYLLAEFARGEVTVALSGDGGDELFAGYERFAAALAAQRLSRLPPRALQIASALLSFAPATALEGRVTSLRRFTDAAARGLPDAYREWLAFFGEDDRLRLVPGAGDWALRDFGERWRATAGAEPLARLLDLNLATYLVDDLLVKVDRMSMAHGLEVRSPFLDASLLELALRIPSAHHIRGLARKRVLKAAVADLLPREILTGRKRGFGVPLDRWFREDLSAYVQSLLNAPHARIRHHLNPDAVDAILTEHQTARRQHGQRLWALSTLELFLRREGW